MDVYNVNENDVKDVGEVIEPEVEQVDATVAGSKKESNINLKGIVYSVASLLLGIFSSGSLFMYNYSFFLCLVASVAGCFFSGKYLFEGNKHKIFGKLALIGFLLAVIGVILGVVRVVLTYISSVGSTLLWVLF